LHDILESQGGLEEFIFRGHSSELLHELNLDVSTEELLSAERAFTYADLYPMLENRNRVMWLTPHVAVVLAAWRALSCTIWRAYGYSKLLDSVCSVFFNADGKDMAALARSSEGLLEICDVVLRLLAATSVVHSVRLTYWSLHYDASINATSFAYLMEQCQSLKILL
jgi:hypothetical protein